VTFYEAIFSGALVGDFGYFAELRGYFPVLSPSHAT